MNIIIVGGGKIGSYLATLLSEDDQKPTIIELRPAVVERLRRTCPGCTVIEGSGSEPATLEKAGILTCDVLVAASGLDEVNLVASMLAKMEYGVGRTVARVNSPANNWMFTPGMGVDVGVNQADIIARFSREEMDMRDVFTLMKLGRGDHAIVQVEVKPDSTVSGKTLKELTFPNDTSVVAVERGGNILVPRGDTRLSEHDQVIIFTGDLGRAGIRSLFA